MADKKIEFLGEDSTPESRKQHREMLEARVRQASKTEEVKKLEAEEEKAKPTGVTFVEEVSSDGQT